MKRVRRQRYYIVEVIDPHYHREEAIKAMEEIEDLVITAGGEVVEKDIQHRVKPHPATYLGSGKLEKLLEGVRGGKYEVILLNDIVTAGQKYRIERYLWRAERRVSVIDRVDLILRIFEKHAASVEAKLQIKLARLEHEGPRVYGLGKTLLSRQAGGIGTRGVGETNIEREKRLIKKQKAKIRKELKRIEARKAGVVESRRVKGFGPVALVGYTSAGKTTLFNRMTGKQKRTDKHYFTTLDTVVGRMKSATLGSEVVISDTIGFIRNLPPELIEAFSSTLYESVRAKLLLMVMDANDKEWQKKEVVVRKTLASLGVKQPVWRVFNKVDLMSEEEREARKEEIVSEDVYWVSAKKGLGIKQLKSAIERFFNEEEETRV